MLMIAAGASLAFGVKRWLGAVGILGFLSIVTPAMHDFWTQTDPGQKQNEIIHFSKNAALAALAAAALAFAGDTE